MGADDAKIPGSTQTLVPRSVPTRDGSRTLFSDRYGQTLHSEHGALTESRWVFLHASGVAARLALREPTDVLEVGFGTGLNFLVTADQACDSGAHVGYVALERELLPPDTATGLEYAEHLKHPGIVEALAEQLEGTRDRGPNARVEHSAHGVRRTISARVCGADLELRIGDATTMHLENGRFHAVYHDGFSPDANPELWTPAFLAELGAALAPGGVLVTYTVKGTVRRTLDALGLEVEKRPGPPGGKREMLWARKPLTPRG